MISSLASALSKFPTVALTRLSTPVTRVERLEQACGAQSRGIRIFVKRDDIGDIGNGGNKLRKLTFLLGQAQAERADTVITVGGIQSNHARLTAAACAKLGLACELFLSDMVPIQSTEYREGGNVLLDRIFGATLTVVASDRDVMAVANARAAELASAGRRVMVIPAGGSSPLGTLGYAKCAQEILEFEAENAVEFRHIVIPNGSHGTQAGLIAGLTFAGQRGGRVKAYSVLADRDTTHAKTAALARKALELLGGNPADVDAHVDVVVDGGYRGAAYGIPTQAMVDAVRLLARTEGILLDPVYSGKAFSGLLADIGNDLIPAGADVLFVATGGVPGLFAYRDTLA
ncbi:D-cysteine desulfhydrase [Pandoraea aquatica]|uniref:D-cysteine desulfhydrase n=1 Tax=Pandoraea aquatica TaxID=2508290 RepID=A0A5E4RNY5_9BURK|nr:D-cysteine desulfhydrase family protein [Pandoraea aquatica]VVD64693.1 D-cysteine desulfhydrase [Pandoraea aquatica]